MSHAHTPPELPEITDEAGASPKWLPWLGVAVFAAGAGWIMMCHGHCSSEAAEGDTAGEAAAP
jgi:hypothetical protein